MAAPLTLHWSPKSPYVRKVMVVAHELGHGVDDAGDVVEVLGLRAMRSHGGLAQYRSSGGIMGHYVALRHKPKG